MARSVSVSAGSAAPRHPFRHLDRRRSAAYGGGRSMDSIPHLGGVRAALIGRVFRRNLVVMTLFELTWGLGSPFAMYLTIVPAYLTALGAAKSLIGVAMALWTILAPMQLLGGHYFSGRRRVRIAMVLFLACGRGAVPARPGGRRGAGHLDAAGRHRGLPRELHVVGGRHGDRPEPSTSGCSPTTCPSGSAACSTVCARPASASGPWRHPPQRRASSVPCRAPPTTAWPC